MHLPSRKLLRAFLLFQLISVLVLGGTMWWCTNTEAGLRFTTRRIEQLVSDNIPGSLVIGAIDGIDWNRIRAHDVRILHQDGRTLLLVRNAEVEPDWTEALHGRLGFRSAAADGGFMVMSMDPDDRLSFEAAVDAPTPPGEPSDPNGGLHYALRSMHVQNFNVMLKFSKDFDYQIQKVEGYVGVLRIDTPGVEVVLERLRGEVKQEIAGMSVGLTQLDGWVRGKEKQVMRMQAKVRLADSTLVTRVDYFDREKDKLKIHVDRAEGIQAAAVELLAKAIASFSSDLSVDG